MILLKARPPGVRASLDTLSTLCLICGLRFIQVHLSRKQTVLGNLSLETMILSDLEPADFDHHIELLKNNPNLVLSLGTHVFQAYTSCSQSCEMNAPLSRVHIRIIDGPGRAVASGEVRSPGMTDLC